MTDLLITKILFLTPITILGLWFVLKITAGAFKEAREEIMKLRQEIKNNPKIENDLNN